MTLTDLRARARARISKTLTSGAYSDAQVDAYLNEAYSEMISWVVQSTGIWEFRGERSTHDLILNQNEYILPSSDFIQINRVEVKYYGQTEYSKADRIDDKQVDYAAFQNGYIGYGDKSRPVYRLFDDSLFIYPAEDQQDSIAGLSIEYTRNVVSLTSGSDVPNLNPLVHRTLAAMAALKYADAQDMEQKARRLRREIYGDYAEDPRCLFFEVQELARVRDRSVKVRVIPRQRSYR